MPIGLKRYQQTGDFHFITFSCYQRLPYLASPLAKQTFEEILEGLRKQRLVERALSYCYGASKPLFSFCEDFRGQISGSVALFRAGFIGYASSTDGRGLGAQRQPDLPSFASAIGSRV
jgi:hypothetical protein